MKYAIEMDVIEHRGSGGLRFCEYFAGFDKDGCVKISRKLDMYKPRLWSRKESAEKYLPKILKMCYIEDARIVEVEE